MSPANWASLSTSGLQRLEEWCSFPAPILLPVRLPGEWWQLPDMTGKYQDSPFCIISLSPGIYKYDFGSESCIFFLIALGWMPVITSQHQFLVMAWCCQAINHYLSQCWLTSMSLYGVTRPQWINDSPGARPSIRPMFHYKDCLFQEWGFSLQKRWLWDWEHQYLPCVQQIHRESLMISWWLCSKITGMVAGKIYFVQGC